MKLLFTSSVLAVLVGCASTVDPSVEEETVAAVDEQGSEVDQSEDAVTAVTYKQTSKIIKTNCGGCHSQFGSLAAVQGARTQMIAKISSGQMPKGKPTWGTTASGKKLLAWLKAGAVK
jgi:mono/diheme cytochrome c family protein